MVWEYPVSYTHLDVYKRQHIAFATEESMVKRANIVFDNVYSWIKGEEKNIVL